MKSVVKVLLGELAACVAIASIIWGIVYLAICFITWELAPISQGERAIFVVTLSLVMLFYTMGKASKREHR